MRGVPYNERKGRGGNIIIGDQGPGDSTRTITTITSPAFIYGFIYTLCTYSHQPSTPWELNGLVAQDSAGALDCCHCTRTVSVCVLPRGIWVSLITGYGTVSCVLCMTPKTLKMGSPYGPRMKWGIQIYNNGEQRQGALAAWMVVER